MAGLGFQFESLIFNRQLVVSGDAILLVQLSVGRFANPSGFARAGASLVGLRSLLASRKCAGL